MIATAQASFIPRPFEQSLACSRRRTFLEAVNPGFDNSFL
jgi:hypothetical protein